MYIISLLISAYSIYDLRVISPIEIALLVPDGILLNFADFGHIPYNSMIKAELVAYE